MRSPKSSGRRTTTTPTPADTTVRPVLPRRTTDEPASAYYANCTEARAAGVAPIPAGAPGYRLPLDRNRDGVACE